MEIETLDHRTIKEPDARAIAELLISIWPKPGRTVETRTNEILSQWRNYYGPEAQYPRSFLVREGDRLVAHAQADPRTIKTSAGEITILALCRVCTDPAVRGKKLGQAVIIDNKPGAGGSIGGTAVARAAADGHTLMLSNSTPISIGPFALEKQPYDPVVDFTHIASIGSAPCVVMANPAAGINTIVDLENAARKSGNLQFGSGGPASIGHIWGELMVRTLGVKMSHVPYRGGAPMTTDLIAGQIPLGIDVITAFVPMVKAGQIRALAVTTRVRSPLLPDVPTVVEVGYPQLVAENYFGVSGPAGMPADVTDKLGKALAAIIADPAIVKRFEELGITPSRLNSAEFTAFIAKQVADWAPAIKAADIKP